MKHNLSLLAALMLLAAATWLVDGAQLSPHADFYAQDRARLDEFADARRAFEMNVLEARAGLSSSFDSINLTASMLRAAASYAGVVSARGPAYEPAAAELALVATAVKNEELAREQFKTDLALLRLSSRYVAQRLELAMPALQALQSQGDTASSDLDVLFGHSQAIVDRRERVDRFSRSLFGSSVRAHLEAARAHYERATRRHVRRVDALRALAAGLAIAGLLLLVSTVMRASRGGLVSGAPGEAAMPKVRLNDFH